MRPACTCRASAAEGRRAPAPGAWAAWARPLVRRLGHPSSPDPSTSVGGPLSVEGGGGEGGRAERWGRKTDARFQPCGSEGTAGAGGQTTGGRDERCPGCGRAQVTYSQPGSRPPALARQGVPRFRSLRPRPRRRQTLSCAVCFPAAEVRWGLHVATSPRRCIQRGTAFEAPWSAPSTQLPPSVPRQ